MDRRNITDSIRPEPKFGHSGLEGFTPQQIHHDVLDPHIIGQEEAKKAASLAVYNHFESDGEYSSVTLMCGPTGSGKTFIWEILQEEFGPRIQIFDASTLSAEGSWKGDYKISAIIKDAVMSQRSPRPNMIIVLDEWDKCLEQQGGANESYSATLQNSFLRLFDHQPIYLPATEHDKESHAIDTNRISIVLLGSFEKLRNAMTKAEKHIGFGNTTTVTRSSYSEITVDDLIAHTAIRPEVAGRINRIVMLDPLTKDDMLRIEKMHIDQRSKLLSKTIKIDDSKLSEIADKALSMELGARYAKSQIDAIIDDMIYEDPGADEYEYVLLSEEEGYISYVSRPAFAYEFEQMS